MKRREFFKKLLGLGAAAAAAPVAAKALAIAEMRANPLFFVGRGHIYPPYFPGRICWTPEPHLVDPDSWHLIGTPDLRETVPLNGSAAQRLINAAFTERLPSTPRTRSPAA